MVLPSPALQNALLVFLYLAGWLAAALFTPCGTVAVFSGFIPLPVFSETPAILSDSLLVCFSVRRLHTSYRYSFSSVSVNLRI